MKGITKLFAVAVAGVALASCSDELDVRQKAAFNDTKADLVGRLESATTATRIALDETADRYYPKAVWTEGDKVQVFSLVGALTHSDYKLNKVDASDPQVGYFDKTNTTSAVGDDKYAVTESESVYAISATPDGKPLLTVTIDTVYTAQQDATGKKFNFPVPYWGKVNTAETQSDGTTKLDVDFKATTGLLRVDVNRLPVGTKAIVLTTHGGMNLDQEEGFQLIPTKPAGYEDTNRWWDEKDAEGKLTHAPYTVGGFSEALAGTFNCVLDPANPEALKVDSRLVHMDTLRVNINPATNKIFYIPLIANTYKNLRVLAVTGDSKYTYRWIGQELKNFQDLVVERNKIIDLMLNMVDLPNGGVVDMNTLNYYLKTQLGGQTTTHGAKYTTIFNVNRLVNSDAIDENAPQNTNTYKTVPSDKIQIDAAEQNVIINVKEVATDFEYGVDAVVKPLLVQEAGSASTTPSAASKRTVELNLPEEWSTTTVQKYVKMIVPTSAVTIGTYAGAASNLVFSVKGCADKFVTGHNLLNADGTDLKDEKKAAINVKSSIATLNVLEGTNGSVYVYTPSGADETEISEALNVQSSAGIDTRITDALVNKLTFVNSSEYRYVFTTGSAALKSVVKFDDTPNPSRVILQSYWTGKKLSAYAVYKQYDVATIYTAAQLSSIGEPKEVYGEQWRSGWGDRTAVSNYQISTLVNHMWLGGTKYPWLGAEVRVPNFKLDGNGSTVSLQNMSLETQYDDDTEFDDPHWCCTSCWTPSELPKLTLKRDLGLIRSIINSDNAEVSNINLNDVYLDTEANINNIGSIVGYTRSNVVKFDNNIAGDVKISVAGDSIGGLFGKIVAAQSVEITKNRVKDNEESGYIKSTKGHVGGIAGAIDGVGVAKVGTVTITNSEVLLTGSNAEISGGNSFVGGVAGQINSNKKLTMNLDKVTVKGNITSGASWAAGLVAKVNTGADEESRLTDNAVDVANIKAKTNYAAGMIGQLDATQNIFALGKNSVKASQNIEATEGKFAAGLIGQTTIEKPTNSTEAAIRLTRETVDVTGSVKADLGYVGGEIGQANLGSVQIGYKTDIQQNFVTDVTIGKIEGALAAGGLVGDNIYESPITICGGEQTVGSGTDAKTYQRQVNVEIKDWNITKGKSFFDASNNDREIQNCGTFSNVLGRMNGNLTIVNEKYLDVEDNLTSAKKIALLYQIHPDRFGNVITNGDKYWGDYNGYVGWSAASAVYTIGDHTVLKEQSSEDGCNLYKSDANYTQESKLIAGE